MIFFNKKNIERKTFSVLIEHIGIMAICLGIIFASIFFSPKDLEEKRGIAKIIPECMFKKITGYPCPSCGMTRAFCSISRGNFAAAFGYNILSFILYPFVLAGALLPPFSLIHYYYCLSRKNKDDSKPT